MTVKVTDSCLASYCTEILFILSSSDPNKMLTTTCSTDMHY